MASYGFGDKFKNAETYVENIAKGSWTATLPIVYDKINGNIGLSGSVMTGIDFNNYPINGVLPIEMAELVRLRHLMPG